MVNFNYNIRKFVRRFACYIPQLRISKIYSFVQWKLMMFQFQFQFQFLASCFSLECAATYKWKKCHLPDLNVIYFRSTDLY